VLALLVVLAGLLSLLRLPVEQYPTIAPPSLQISFNYPGADAATLDENVTSVVEQELNGVDGLIYMSSSSNSDGSASITATFESGTDIDLAQVDVQNRLSRVESRLPEEIRRQGIFVFEASTAMLMIAALYSPDGSWDPVALGNYASTRMVDTLRRVPGVGDLQLFGSQYAMRIWLDPMKLAGYELSAAEALAAVREQNSQTAGGQIGDTPSPPGQQLNVPIVTESRLKTAEQFGEIILKAQPDGSTVRLKDVARVELGAESYGFLVRADKRPAVGIAFFLENEANALSVVRDVEARLEDLSRDFPPGIAYEVPYETAEFIRISVEEVLITLGEAILLVFAVMYLFLQNLRATLIPTVVVPVALLGACAVLYLTGSSINVLSLFGMVLVIGILVDDAIIVIENVERIMSEEGMSAFDATRKAMNQISGAVVGITLVLVSVFIPMAFFPGTVGGIYREFSLTLASSIAFSALLALTLTPALCATLLKHRDETKKGGFFGRFNSWFDRMTGRYTGAVAKIVRAPLRWMAAYLAVGGATLLLFNMLPSSFLPVEDQGSFPTIIQLPSGATQERTLKMVSEVEDALLAEPQVIDTVALVGFSVAGNAQNAAMIFAGLKPWDERPRAEDSADAVIGRLMGKLGALRDGFAFPLQQPSIPGLGEATGFDMRLQDIGGNGTEALLAARNQLLGLAAQSSVVAGVRPQGLDPGARVEVTVDRIKARALGLSIGDINDTLSITFGSAYANDFVREGRVLRVLLQAEPSARVGPADILQLRVRNSEGEMVPFSSFVTARWESGPIQLERYNGVPAMNIQGAAAPGHSTGEAMQEMERLAEQLPAGFGIAWTGLSLEEQESAGQVPLLLTLSLLMVFLVLAALYESWAIPLSVVLVVPLGILGSVLATFMRGYENDVFFKVGLVTIIGLSAKNAILIIEFAKDLRDDGMDLWSAAVEAARLRLRPIIMTSLAFTLGVVPLVISSGAGAASRRAIGTGVLGGMLSATFLAIFFVPVFFVAVLRYLGRDRGEATPRGRVVGAVGSGASQQLPEQG
jgi:multidrug efflux pump